jgi:hypothetical protein
MLTMHGPLPLLPGFPQPGAGEAKEGAPPSKAPPRRDGASPRKQSVPEKPPDPDAPPDAERKQPKTPGDVRVTVQLPQEEFDAGAPVPAMVTAAPTGELASAKTFDVRIAVDEADADSGATLHVDPAVPDGMRTEVDVAKVPALKLVPGEHTLRARLTTRDSHEEHWSDPVTFRIRPPKDDKKDDQGPKGDQPKPKPKPEPQEKPQQREPQAPPKQDDPKKGGGPPPLPPAALDRKVVVPLFRDGEEVKKTGLVLVLDPSGGTGAPPARRPLDDALPEARRQAEESVDNARVPAEDKALVRRYFDGLETLRK